MTMPKEFCHLWLAQAQVLSLTPKQNTMLWNKFNGEFASTNSKLSHHMQSMSTLLPLCACNNYGMSSKTNL
jgi:hypothetical protein